MMKFLVVSEDATLRAGWVQRLQRAFQPAYCREVAGIDALTTAFVEDTYDLILGDEALWQKDVAPPGPEAGRSFPPVLLLNSQESAVSIRGEGFRVLSRSHWEYLEEAVLDCLERAALRRELAQTREALRQEQARTQQLLDLMAEPVIFVDKEGAQIWANTAAFKAVGIRTLPASRDELAALIEARRLDGVEMAGSALPSSRALQGEVLWDEPLIFMRSDGEEFQTHVSAAPLWERGKISGAVMIWHDITESARWAAENRWQRRLLEQVVNLAPIGIAVLRKGDYRFEFVNPFYQAIFGFETPPLLGRTVAEVFPWAVSREGINVFERVVQSGKSFSIQQYEVVLGPDRDPSYWDSDYVPLFAEDGTVEQVLVLVHEVTAQVVARREAERVATQDEAIMANMTEGVLISDGEGNILQINPAAMVMHGRDRPVKFPISVHTLAAVFDLETLEGEPLPMESWPLFRALQGETFNSLELRVRAVRTGEWKAVSYGGAPVRDAAGKIILAVVTSRDVTAQKAVEREREQLLAQVEQKHRETQGLARILDRERQKLQIIMENTHAQLTYLDRNFNFVSVNLAYIRASGYSEAQLIGRNHFDLFPSAENQLIFEEVRETGISRAFTAKPFIHPHYPDLPTYWDWTLAPVKSWDGRVEGLVLSLTDVTDRERVRQDRERYLVRLNMLIRASEAVLAETTLEGLLERVVDTAQELIEARIYVAGYGHQPEHFVVRTAAEVEPFCLNDLACWDGSEGVYQALQQGTRYSLLLTEEELVERFGKGGHSVRGALGARMTGIDGQSSGLIVVLDRLQGPFSAEDEALLSQLAALAAVGGQHIEARQDAERRANEMAAIFAAMADVVIVFGEDGRPMHCNPAAESFLGFMPIGLARDTIQQRCNLRYADGEGVPLPRLPSTRALNGETVVNERFVVTHRLGQERVILSSATPICRDDKIGGAVLVWRDITEREQMLGQLAAERARFKAVIDHAPEGIIVLDEAHQIVLTNPAADRICGRPIPWGAGVERQTGLMFCYPDETLYYPEDLPWVRSVQTGEIFSNVEMKIFWPTGEWRALLVSSASICDASGCNGSVAVLQDVTEQKRTENAVRRYADLLEVLHRIDQAILEAGSVAEISEVALRYLPQMISCLRVGVVIFDFEMGMARIHAFHTAPEIPDIANYWEGLLDDLWYYPSLNEGVPLITEDVALLAGDSFLLQQLKSVGVRAYVNMPLMVQGKLIGALNVGFRLAGAPDSGDLVLLQDLAGPLAIGIQQAQLREQVANYAQDLEQLVVQRTADLQSSEARFRAIFEHAALGVALVDGTGRVLESNPAIETLLGYSAEELQAIQMVDLVHPDYVDSHRRLFVELAAGNREPYTIEECYCRKDGGAVLVSMSGSLIRDGEEPRHVVMLFKDITEQKRIQSALIQSEKLAMAGKLAASLAHEINNPLQAVIGCLGLAEEMLQEGGDTSRYLKVAGEELLRAARIVGQLRDLNRQPLPQERVWLNINELVERVLVLSRKQCANQQVEVRWHPDPDVPRLAVTADQLVQVFLNLVLNALEAMPDGGSLQIDSTCTTDPPGVQLRFQDSGAGITDEVLPNIFTPFYTTKNEGLGLGLFVCQNIVTAHRGYIRAESHMGQGTCFTVWLPV